MIIEKKGKELEFISWIKRDGSGTIPVGGEWNCNMDRPKIDDMSYLDDEVFRINSLSITEKTFIACGFNSFVVRLKPEPAAEISPTTPCVHPYDQVVNRLAKPFCNLCKTHI